MGSYSPPIAERTTENLLKITDSPQDWEDDVIEAASHELRKRGISKEAQKRRAKSTHKHDKRVKEIKKNASYSYLQMLILLIFAPFTFAWLIPSGMGVLELESEGYLRKRNQRFILISLGCLLWFFTTFYLLE